MLTGIIFIIIGIGVTLTGMRYFQYVMDHQ